MRDQYQLTSLWRRTLGGDEKHDVEHVDRLRVEYLRLRNNATQLTSHIAAALPGLTIHDVTHLDALWETADLIAGPNYPINPMEAFVLGGAFLLHDAALCFEAYAGGRDGVRQTVEWKDAYATEKGRATLKIEDEIKAAADFSAIRTLHAAQASLLGLKAWVPPNGSEVFLIDDRHLRDSYGAIIGQIAASHHWPIDDLKNLPDQVNASGELPREWRVDAVKLACILRCADAAHIDSRRAPDFLHALTRRVSISAAHWTAQNWLSRVDLEQSDPTQTTLLFTSRRSFGPNDVDAWWVAFDMITLVDVELRASNALLESRASKSTSPPFRSRRVVGVSSPDEMSRFVKVYDWHPCSAKIHVSNIENLVRSLGGENLYGKNELVAVVLRELIQNSVDAVKAKRTRVEGYRGKIQIKYLKDLSDVAQIQVCDDGVGMSEGVLTGPLLDFGTSFWASDLVKTEFPGLRSSSFRSVGKYGVGFYSAFMIASSITISSRRWDTGLEDIVTLSFPRGLTLRPTLTRGFPQAFPADMSTKVSLALDPDASQETKKLVVKSNRMGQPDFQVALDEYIAAIVVGIDVDVEYRGPMDTSYRLIHMAISAVVTASAGAQWLKEISLPSFIGHQALMPQIQEHSSRLRPLIDHGEVVGYAALSTLNVNSADYLGTPTVGGLSSNVSGRSSQNFIGFLDYQPDSAKRNPGTSLLADPDLIAKWADEQVNLLRASGANAIQWCAATYSLCGLGADPISCGMFSLMEGNQLRFYDLRDIADICERSGIAVYRSSHIEHIDAYTRLPAYGNIPTYAPLRNADFLSLEMNGDAPRNQNSLIGCMYRLAALGGKAIFCERIENVAAGTFGPVHVNIYRCR